ncbi:MAG: diaminopimelate decarboxylase [Candidatus Omnitrophica bacterium]|nr:diaminopimelate decarboxylase [Candidatus Omnitrophota bacterium]
MDYFLYKKGKLYCDGLAVEKIVKDFSTPLYVYSSRTILEHFVKIKKAFAKLKPLICYSVKANSNLSIMKLMVENGAGLDIVSGGELFRAKKIKCKPEKIVYASVGKTDQEIKQAILYGILMFNVESLAELNRINSVAKSLRKKVTVALRFNPDVEANTHSYITTGKKENKFGMDSESVSWAFLNKSSFPNLSICGIHIHIGSQITEGAPFVSAVKKTKQLITSLRANKSEINYLNIGGGLGIVYNDEKPQTAKEFADLILPLLEDLKVRLILEPGRFIVGNAGILVTSVTYIKEALTKRFVIVDAAMNDLARPSLYGAYHKILPLNKSLGTLENNEKKTDIVGPVCESGDFLGKDRQLSVKQGENISVFGAGAYGFSMSSNYNSRLRVAEVLVKNRKAYLIRKRENYSDLVRNEVII